MAFALDRAGKLTEDSIGLTVNAVTPGLTETDMTAEIPDKLVDGIKALIPIHQPAIRRG